MHSIAVSQVRDDDIITTADSDPAGLSVSVLSTGEIIDVHTDLKAPRPHGPDGLSELFAAAHAERFTEHAATYVGTDLDSASRCLV